MTVMPTTSPYLMLLDTPALYFRAFYGIPDSVTAPDGTPVNAVRGLLDMIARLINPGRSDRAMRGRPARLVAWMDAGWRPPVRAAAEPRHQSPPPRPRARGVRAAPRTVP